MPYALTPEVRVHDYTEGRQSASHSRSLPDGGYVTVWSGSGPEDRGYGVYLQRYDGAGARVGGPILVNTTTVYSQRNPQIAVLESGGYAVVWDDTIPGVAGTRGLFTQTFDASGARVGGETQNSPDGGFQQISALPSGGYVVTWTHQVEYPFSVVSARIYDASGQPRGPGFILNDDQIAGFSNVVATDTGFLAVWRGSTGATTGVQAYDASGSRIGEALRIPRDGGQTMPEITRLADGRFVLVWAEADGLHGQLLTASGEIYGSRFLVQTAPQGASLLHAVVSTPDGGFTVAWDQFSGASGRDVIAVASFFADGSRNGDTLTVRQGQTEGEPPGLVVLPNGDVVVTYARYVGDSLNFFDLFQTRLTAAPGMVNGSPSHDRLTGSAGVDRLLGHAGDDILIGGLGDDRLEGGAGWDEAVFAGSSSLYKIYETPDGEYRVTGPNGRDSLVGIEMLRFADRTIDLTRMVLYPPPEVASGAKGSPQAHADPIQITETLLNLIDPGVSTEPYLNPTDDWSW